MLRGSLIVIAAAALVAAQASWSAAGGAAVPAAPPAKADVPKAAAPPAKAAAPIKERLPDPITGEYTGKLIRPGQDTRAEGKVLGARLVLEIIGEGDVLRDGLEDGGVCLEVLSLCRAGDGDEPVFGQQHGHEPFDRSDSFDVLGERHP